MASRTFSMPSADSSSHPPGCRYGRPGTVFRDPIPASVSYFWIAPAWSSRRNWCLKVVHFACSSSSTLPSIFLTLISLRRQCRARIYIYLFYPLMERGLKSLFENYLYDGPSDSKTHHFETSTLKSDFLLPPLRNFHGPFSLSSMRSLTYQPRISANLGSFHLSRILSQIDVLCLMYHTKVNLSVSIYIIMSFVNVMLICVP